MRIPRVYTPQTLASGETIPLEEGPSRHIGKVLRMQEGRALIVFNGQGGEYSATITTINKKSVVITIGSLCNDNRQSPLDIHLAIGLSRTERFDWVLQKATELGVTRITPLFTERTEIKLNAARLEKKTQHWQQIIISACEQCQRNLLPALHPPERLVDWLDQQAQETERLKLVLHHRSKHSLNEYQRPTKTTVLIGPEGGLSEQEIQQSEKSTFQPLTLGPRVFRTETAPIVTLSLLQYLWGDF